MANCFENLPACVWFEGGDKRNAFASLLAGFLVGINLRNTYRSFVFIVLYGKIEYRVCKHQRTLHLQIVN